MLRSDYVEALHAELDMHTRAGRVDRARQVAGELERLGVPVPEPKHTTREAAPRHKATR